MKNQYLHLIKMVCLVLFISLVAPAAIWAKSYVNTNWQGVAIKGYDTVAYFTEGRPIKGNKQFEYQWQGAKWRFANQKNLEMFSSTPDKYAPRYGGY